jgi:ArsR family metal-binding transcriptional regulator
MPGDLLKRRLGAMRKKVMETNSLAKGWPAQVIEEYAMRLLREEVAMDIDLPLFEDFRNQSQEQLV